MKKIGYIAMLAAMLVVFLASMVSAGTIFYPYTNGTNACGTQVFTYNTTQSETTNLTLFYKLSSASGWTVYATRANMSENQTNWTISVVTSGFADGEYKFNFSGQNMSGAFLTSNYMNTTVDNTAPQWTFAGDSTKNKDSVYIEELLVKGTTDETSTSASVRINNKDYSLSGSTTSWSKQFVFSDANKIPEGVYEYVLTIGADDTTCANTGDTDSRKVTLISKKSPSVAIAAQQQQQTQQAAAVATQTAQDDDNTTIIIIAVVAIVAYMYFEGKGRRK